MNVSFWVMIKYRSFYRKTNKLLKVLLKQRTVVIIFVTEPFSFTYIYEMFGFKNYKIVMYGIPVYIITKSTTVMNKNSKTN